MRLMIVALCLSAFLPMTSGCNLSPAVAQAPAENFAIQRSNIVTVVYSVTTDKADEFVNATFLNLDPDWLVVEFKSRRIFIARKNVIRIEVGPKSS